MNPAEHSARDEAERLGVIVGSDVDRVEDALLAELLVCCSCSQSIVEDDDAADDLYIDEDGATYHESCYQP